MRALICLLPLSLTLAGCAHTREAAVPPPAVAAVESEPERCTLASSRLRREAPCQQPGLRVYQAEDLRGTGEFEVGAALRRLDPAIR